MSHLVLEGVTKRFGGLVAVNNVGFVVDPNSVCSVIGPNGAGKTTLFNLITGVSRPDRGKITLHDVSLIGNYPEHIAQQGISRTFQNIRLFKHLSAIENVLVGTVFKSAPSFLQQLVIPFGKYALIPELLQKATSWLEWVGYKADYNKLPQELSYGDQRRIEIARALATEPNLLILDEPTAGMVAQEAHQVIELIHKLRSAGMTIMLIEHNMNVVSSVSDKVVVLNFGQKLAEGSPEEIKKNPEVISAYLGAEQ